METSFTTAVDIRDGEKCYNRKPVFTKLNMHVPRGKIYALLGPSGCGKTTLLRCILGRLRLDKGSLLVFGHSLDSEEIEIPGAAVGYMSQDASVYFTMTIGEYLRYFGTIFGLPSDQIRSKTKYFIELLRLPKSDTLASKLSGGQLKRVQFAAALIHDPKLIILDEPTVGIDVITKRRMWEHLVKLTLEKDTTILLTTHYIEEARLADRVGMIHGCTMAAEDTTENLLNRHDETTLEGVFLKICYTKCDGVVNNDELTIEVTTIQNEDSGNRIVESDGRNCSVKNLHRSTKRKGFGLNIAWHRLYALMIRHFIGLYRFPGLLLLLVILPSNQVFMFILTMGHLTDGIPMTVVNEDAGDLGAKYLSQLNPEIVAQKPCHDYDAGLQAVVRGESQGILRIGSNFSAVFHRRFSDYALSNEEIVKAGTIYVKMDNTNLNAVKFAELHVLNVFQDFLQETFTLAGMNPAAGQLPVMISQKTAEVLSRPPSIFILSGEAVISIFFSSLPFSLIGIFMDKHKGYMEPNIIAGVNAAETFLGLLLVQLIVLIIQNVGIILAALPVLIEFNKGSPLLIFSLLYVQGICGTSLGILLSLLCDNIPMMFGVVSNVLFLSCTMAGILWPIEAMPAIFRYICMCLPSTLTCRALESIIHRGWDLRYLLISGAFGITFLWTFIFLGFSILLFDRKK